MKHTTTTEDSPMQTAEEVGTAVMTARRCDGHVTVHLKFDTGRVAVITIDAGITDEELEIVTAMARAFLREQARLDGQEEVN